MSLRTIEIAFKFHGGGKIMAGIIKAEPWRRSCKTPGYTYIYIYIGIKDGQPSE